MKVKAKKDRCTGHARCAAIAPDIFHLDDNGYIALDEWDIPSNQTDLARRGVHACPEGALRLATDRVRDQQDLP